MDFPALQQEAFELSQVSFDPLEITPIPILDFPEDSQLASVGLVFEEEQKITTTNLADVSGSYVKGQPRASTHTVGFENVFIDENGDGLFEMKTYEDAAPDYSNSIIQPPIDPAEIPPAGRVISQLTVGAAQPEEGFPQFLTIGAEGFFRFNGFVPQTVGSSGRIAAHNIFSGATGGVEDFPFIRDIYVTILEGDRFELLLLVDSEAFTAAVSMTIDPDVVTTLDVDGVFFPRRDVLLADEPDTAFLAYSSMFWKNEHHTTDATDDEAHDSDTLIFANDTTGDRSPEKIVTSDIRNPGGGPSDVALTKFEDVYAGQPVFVALENRDQDSTHYSQYATANYAARDSYAFEIIHSDVELGLHMYEQPTGSEFNDNIVVAVTIQEDLHPASKVEEGIRVTSRHYAYYPTDSTGDGISNVMQAFLDEHQSGQPVARLDHMRSPAVLNVPTQFPSIQEAIDAARLGDTVRVEAGVYTEDLNITTNGLRIEGAGAGQTFLEGVPGTVVPVVQFEGVDRSVVFTGFTVRNGESDIASQGGGIDILNASPIILDNVISNNSSKAVGGGISIRGGASNPLVQSNEIHDNQTRVGPGNFAGLGGAIYIGDAATGVIRENRIHNNSAWLTAGGIYSGPLFSGVFELMTGGGSTLIERNWVVGNSADHNIGIEVKSTISGAQVVIRNNVITDHTGGVFIDSTGVAITDASALVTNNTIVDNGVYGVRVTGSSIVDVRNNIIVNNSTGIHAGALIVAEYNDVWNNAVANYAGGVSEGTGWINADPQFQDAANADYSLLPGSLAINAGDLAPEFDDADGSRNDMGAFGGPGVKQLPHITIADSTFVEAADMVTFIVHLSAVSVAPVTVQFATSNGTAQSGEDYLPTTGTVTFAPGETSQKIVVEIQDDLDDEVDEVFALMLASATNGIITDAAGSGTIVDNDATPTIVTGVALNEPLPNVNRSGIGTLKFTFDLPVNVAAAASLKLFNHSTGAPIDVSTAGLLNNGTPSVTWDFSSLSLPNGRYTAKLATDQVTTTVGGPLQSTHAFEFFKLAGDVDGDGFVNFNDFFAVDQQFNTSGSPYRPGDADGDGLVNFNDFFAVDANFNTSVTALEYDFGDAGELGTSFPTTLSNDGARHVITGNTLFLGTARDADADGQPNATATGDDTDGTSDETGVNFIDPLEIGNTNVHIDITASVPDGAAVLNGWIDFNRDGDWDDPGEQLWTDVAMSDGVNHFFMTIPATASAGTAIARFRLTETGGYSHFGLAPDGEVEDYQVTLTDPLPSAAPLAATAEQPSPSSPQLSTPLFGTQLFGTPPFNTTLFATPLLSILPDNRLTPSSLFTATVQPTAEPLPADDFTAVENDSPTSLTGLVAAPAAEDAASVSPLLRGSGKGILRSDSITKPSLT